jgi:hypothetical protein
MGLAVNLIAPHGISIVRIPVDASPWLFEFGGGGVVPNQPLIIANISGSFGYRLANTKTHQGIGILLSSSFNWIVNLEVSPL